MRKAPGAPLAEAQRRLAAFSEARQYLGCLLGSRPEDRALWEKVLSLSRRALARAPNQARALLLKGRALSYLGRGSEGLSSFDRALLLEPGAPLGWAWRGEAHLLAGRAEAAKTDLDRAVSCDGSWPWARVLRAAAALALGDCPAAEADLAAAVKVPEACEAAEAIWALSFGQRGDAAGGLKRLDAALTRKPSGLLFAMRGLLRRGAGDLPGSLADLNEAVTLEPSAWLYSQRADTLNRTGFYKEALDDISQAERLAPGSPEPLAQAANVYFDQAFYPEALGKIDAALKLAPDSPELLARRARFYLVLTRLADAEADLRRAERLAEGSSQLLFERLQVMALRDRFAAVLKEAARVPAPFDEYLRGYVRCRQRRYAEARAHFLRSAAKAEGGFAERVRFYALICRVLEGDPPRRRGAPAKTQFYLCGIGIHHPYQITTEILRTLAGCDVLYNNLGDPQVSEFLGLFPGEVRAVARVPDEPAMGRVRRILAGLKPRRATGFVTRIHPFIYRRIANDLVTVCLEKGIAFQAYGAVSLTEVSWGLGRALAPKDAVEPFGLRVFDIAFLNKNPGLLAPAFAAVVYCIAGPEDRKALCRLLEKSFPPSHEVYLLAGSGDKEQQVEAVPLERLQGRLLAVDLGAVLYVPAAAGGEKNHG